MDCAAAAVFAAAVAYSASALASILAAALLGPAAFALAFAGLQRIKDEQLHDLALFDVEPIDPPGEVAEHTDDENVVRLFDPRQVAIARPSATPASESPKDAGQALSDALADLKRSLR